MIQRVQTLFVDDRDGESPADETVHFSLDGVDYEIDLTHANAEQLRAALQPWRDSGRRVRRGKRTGTTAANGTRRAHRATRIDPAQSRAIREWAAANGLVVSGRGKIPASVHQAYEAAHV
jgi:hypothetical protein